MLLRTITINIHCKAVDPDAPYGDAELDKLCDAIDECLPHYKAITEQKLRENPLTADCTVAVLED